MGMDYSGSFFTLIVRQILGLGPQDDSAQNGRYVAAGSISSAHRGSGVLGGGLFILATVLFSLCLGYQFVMVNIYRLMDVIDFDGWTFGQVVAVLFWVPPALEIFHSVFGEQPL